MSRWRVQVYKDLHGVCVCVKSLQSCPYVALWTVAHQIPLSLGFSRQEYWSGLQCPPVGYIGIPV